MASQNNQANGAGAAMGVVAAGMLALAFVIFAVGALLAFVCTILSIIAWRKPLQIGRFVLTPTEARWFIYGGVIGLYALPFFLAFCATMLELSIPHKYWDYAYLAGYILGSFGGALIYDELKAPEPPALPQIEPTYIQHAPTRPTPKPFEYASWDDEEESQ